jgi:hypothetical protein
MIFSALLVMAQRAAPVVAQFAHPKVFSSLAKKEH